LSLLITLNDTHTHTHAVGVLLTRDRPVADTCTWQHTTFTKTDIHVSGGIRTQYRSKRVAADPCLSSCGQPD